MSKFSIGFAVVVGFASALLAGPSDAGTGVAPASITIDGAATVDGIETATMIVVGNLAVPVFEQRPVNNTNPEGISIIRGSNHAIPRVAPGKPTRLVRIEGDPDGTIFVWYTGANGLGGTEGRIRRISPTNQKSFDMWLPVDTKAGMAADGAGGVYVASHFAFKPHGEALMTATKHRTYRLDPAGNIVWQVEEPHTPKPHGDSDHWSSAARSSDGVYVGYGISDADENAIPVLLHRRAGDGSTIFVRTGLTLPAVPGVAAIPPGKPGTAPLRGRVHQIFVAADGTPLAVVHDDTSPHLVRLDAAGVQTHVYPCAQGSFRQWGAGEVACVKSPGDDLEITRYGVRDNKLLELGKFTVTGGATLTLGNSVALPGGHSLFTTRNGSGHFGIHLRGPGGATLAGATLGIGGKVSSIVGVDGKWVGYGFNEAEGKHTRFYGTYDTGGTALPTTKSKLPMPKQRLP